MESEAVVNAVLLTACVALVIALVKKIFFPEKFTPTTAAKLPEIDPRDFTLAELREFDGSDPCKPLLVALSGKVYDVTPSKGMYGPGKDACSGGYGIDATSCVACKHVCSRVEADLGPLLRAKHGAARRQGSGAGNLPIRA